MRVAQLSGGRHRGSHRDSRVRRSLGRYSRRSFHVAERVEAPAERTVEGVRAYEGVVIDPGVLVPSGRIARGSVASGELGSWTGWVCAECRGAQSRQGEDHKEFRPGCHQFNLLSILG